MKATEYIDIAILSILNNRRLLCSGMPGCAKTETNKQAVNIIRDIANGITYNSPMAKIITATINKRADYWKKIKLMILHPVVSDTVDYKGFPFINADGEADFVPFAYLKMMMDADYPLVVFFDDIGQANNSVQAALMQILLERSVNGKKISKDVIFIAATNRRKDGAGVSNIITPLLNRFSSIVDMEVDANDWCLWASKNNMPIELISFIRFCPKLISTFKAEKDIKNFASPRSIAELGQWINEGVTNFEVWQGCVGEAFAVEFNAFYSIFKSIAHLPDQIFNHPNKAEVPTKPDIVYALMGVLSKRANDVNIDNLFIYMDRLPIEYQVVIVSNLITMKPELTSSKAYIDWCVKNPDKI